MVTSQRKVTHPPKAIAKTNSNGDCRTGEINAAPLISMQPGGTYPLKHPTALAQIRNYFERPPLVKAHNMPEVLTDKWWRVHSWNPTAGWITAVLVYSDGTDSRRIEVTAYVDQLPTSEVRTRFRWDYSGCGPNWGSQIMVSVFTDNDIDKELKRLPAISSYSSVPSAAHATPKGLAGSLVKQRSAQLPGPAAPPAVFRRPTDPPVRDGWPTPQEYNEAVQMPQVCFKDPELRNGTAAVNALGLPKADSGAFASVYKFTCDDAVYAVKCFTHEVQNQTTRFEQISSYVLSDDLECTVAFDFITEGILVRGRWYPILKMEWVNGAALANYIDANYRDSVKIFTLVQRFREMLGALHTAEVAHGDLQHGNILIQGDGHIRLVDYDGMYVPGLAGWHSEELGHRNYQHPQRTGAHFGAYLDNFSAWIIDLSLYAIAIDFQLWQRRTAGEECLLFKQADFVSGSGMFDQLLLHEDPTLRARAAFVKQLLSIPPDAIPPLTVGVDSSTNSPVDASQQSASKSADETADRLENGNSTQQPNPSINLPDWMQ